MKVIFLDIDGVLVNHRSWDMERSFDHPPADPCCVRALNRIIESSGAVIVVTSTWRIDRDLPQIQEIVNGRFGVIGEVIGMTPRITSQVFPGEASTLQVAAGRGEEITAWLLAHGGDVQSFVIVGCWGAAEQKTRLRIQGSSA